MGDLNALERAQLSLDGLSLGDAFGERFFGELDAVLPRIVGRVVPGGVWPYTDDTEMALSIVEVLAVHGEIVQDELAARFAARMQPERGYGEGTFKILRGVQEGRRWKALASSGFRHMGSFGNGAAMRVAPLGAYFAEESLEKVALEARLSAEVTHAHPEGIAGAIAVAVAAALAWRERDRAELLGQRWIERTLEFVPAGYTRDAIADAHALPQQSSIVDAAKALGNGSGVTAPDTVPLCLWVAARHSNDLVEALWTTVTALGDRDTTCAIVGGIVALKTGREGIPASWLAAREPFDHRLPCNPSHVDTPRSGDDAS